MIHPMWTEFAKIAFREYLKDDGEDGESFADWADRITDASSVMADKMCVEYDKRNQPEPLTVPNDSAY